MSVTDRLHDMRTGIDSCSLIAFGDLRTRLVLVSSATRQQPQERLDLLCREAAACFDAIDLDIVRAYRPELADAPLRNIFVLTPRETRVHVRSETDVSDVLSGVCGPAGDAIALASGSSDTLAGI